jgi:signal transduction histidine kinase
MLGLLGVWTAAILLAPWLRFAFIAPYLQIGMQSAATMALLFAALILLLTARGQMGRRLGWLAAGFTVLGVGGLSFGYLPWTLDVGRSVNPSAYAWLLLRTIAGLLFVIGLIPAAPPWATRRTLLFTLAAFAPLSVAVLAGGAALPPLLNVSSLALAADRGDAVLDGLTTWYLVLSCVPLALALAAVGGAARRLPRGEVSLWVLVAMALLAGSQLHSMFWPTAFSPVVSTADMLRFAFAIVVAIGGLLNLYGIAAERGRLLDTEQERARQLAELTEVKASFARMVAHELGSPATAIQRLTEVLELNDLSPEDSARIVKSIQRETSMLTTLISDIHTAATIEREDFTVRCAAVPLAEIFSLAREYARALPGEHGLTITREGDYTVWADRQRIGQVLRNLLSNAAKYSPHGAPICIRTVRRGKTIRIEVVDRGAGISMADWDRIFGDFVRGSAWVERQVPGLGLGLHISKRILEGHGTSLTVASVPGFGATFGFDLGIVE